MKRLTAFLLGCLLLGNMVFVPKLTKAEELKVWKFDFTAEGTTKEGYLPVTPDMHVINNENRQYGFIGTNEKDYRLHGGRIDGFNQLAGQSIDLKATDCGIGSLGIKDKEVTSFNSGDYYPVRFALKVQDETYYRVKATVTTLDGKNEAVASLYTERKHPIFTNKVIKAKEEVTSEFTVRVTPVYYEKSDPKGLVPDGYVSVCLLGDNAALKELVIEEIPTATTLWIVGDSTVTDGGGDLPFFPLGNYTGVGSGVTKYIGEDIAVVNEGEGGLSAHDNNHFNVIKERLKEGDFLWVEYGHNHKSDGVAGYESVIGKYYDACKKAGATLVLVGPIDRINNYDANTNTWNSSLKGFSDAAKKFVDDKLKADSEDKVAFVDLNAPSLDWFGEITKEGVVGGEKYTNEKRLVYFYFQAARGAKDVDHTHPNDVGAENLAYLFFENADSHTYSALKPLLERYEAGRSETPVRVKESVLEKGFPANDAWTYFAGGVKHEYPLEITDVEINENDEIVKIMCKLLDKTALSSYAAGFVEVGGETYQSTIESHIDNSAANNGSIYTVEFKEGERAVLGDTPYRVYMAGVDMADNDKKLEGIKPFSKDYVPGKYSEHILRTADDDVERFDYYGYDTLTGSGDWGFGGKLSDQSLGSDSKKSFVQLKGEGFSLSRALAAAVDTSGRYEFSVDVKAMGGKIKFSLSNGWRSSVPYIQGDSITLFEVWDDTVMLEGEVVGKTIVDEWTKVTCVLDMDEGRLTVKADGNEKTVVLDKYCTFNSPEVQSMYHFVITGEGAVDVKLSELWGAKCKTYDKTRTVIDVTVEGTDYGCVLTDGEKSTYKEAYAGEWVKLKAEPNEKGRFIGWYCGDEEYSFAEEIDVRLYKSLQLTAKFLEQTPKTSVRIDIVDAKGQVIKSEIALKDINGRELHEEMKFTVDEGLKEPVIIEKEGYKEVYLFNRSENEVIEKLLPEGENLVRLFFDYDGKYVMYEDFSAVEGTWGFDKEAMAGDGVLHLLTGVGTANRVSSVKAMDENIKAMKKLTVRFEWKNDVDTAKGRNSAFELLDDGGVKIFSISAKGKDGIGYTVAEGEENAISKNYVGVNDWYEITLSIDFENKAITGSIKNLSTGAVTEIAPANTNAACLAKISATYGYSSASQQLSSFAVRDDQSQDDVTIVKKEGTMVTARLKGKRDGKHILVAGVYEKGVLKRVCTKNVVLSANEATEITFDTEIEGEVAVFII